MRHGKEDPSLAVAHGFFWQYHPEKVEELKTKEQQRRQRNKDRVDSGQEG